MERAKKKKRKKRRWGIDTLLFLLDIYTWRDFWFLIATGLLVVGVWLVFAFALALPVLWRNIVLWSLIILLIIGSAIVKAQREGKI